MPFELVKLGLNQIIINPRLIAAFSALTLLVGQPEGHPACKKN